MTLAGAASASFGAVARMTASTGSERGHAVAALDYGDMLGRGRETASTNADAVACSGAVATD
jgi:hypothetical protein